MELTLSKFTIVHTGQTSQPSNYIAYSNRPGFLTLGEIPWAFTHGANMDLLSAIVEHHVHDLPAEAIDTSQLPATVMTLEEHRQIFLSIVRGQLKDPDQIRSHFERLCRDYPLVTNELYKLKKDDLKKLIAGCIRNGVDKEYLVESALNDMFNQYGFLTQKKNSLISNGFTRESYIVRNRSRLQGLTLEMLDQYYENYMEEVREIQRAVDVRIKAFSNPQTLEEYRIFLRSNTIDKLTPEQQNQYDELAAKEQRERQQQENPQQSTVIEASNEHAATLIETVHTRDRYPLFVVQLLNRVDPEEFKRLSGICKSLQGWYSSYRANGAIPGFQFKTSAHAEKFLNVLKGCEIDFGDLEESRSQAKVESAAERLIELGEKSQDRATEVLNRDRKTNTSRRATIATSIENSARRDLAIAKTIQNVGEALQSGELTHLANVRTKTQIELLTGLLQSAKSRELDLKYPSYSERQEHRDDPITIETVAHIRFPEYQVTPAILDSVASNISNLNGLKRIGARLTKMSKQLKVSPNLKFRPLIFDDICARTNSNERLVHWTWVGTYADRQRLIRMKINTIEQLRLACRELVDQIEEKTKADRATELERQLIGSQVGIDFFPTKFSYAQYMVAVCGVSAGKRTLEPQAGNGMIASAIRLAGVEPDVCEISSSLREILVAKKFNIVAWDFLELKETSYDCIVANPPFSNNLDITLTRHAYGLLAEGGCLTTIVGEGAFTRSGKVEAEFRAWLESLGAIIEEVPEDTFSDPSLMVNTKAKARLVKIYR